MARTITNAKQIQRKSRVHSVEPLYGDTYRVKSGASGNLYVVRVTDSGATCSCPWGQVRPAATGHRSGCSHVAAVYEYRAAEEGRRVSLWSNEESARRQHRPATEIGDGVILTSRKVPA